MVNLLINLTSSDEVKISNETAVCLLNLLATVCIVKPEAALKLLEMNVLKMIIEVIQNSESAEVKRFALSSFVEIVYANKGHKYQNIVQMLRTAQDITIDDTLIKLIKTMDQLRTDSEAVSVWGTLVRMIASVPKKEDYIREILLQNKILSL